MTPNQISPKVIAAAIVGLVISALASNVTALTPHLFDFLGPWALFWFGVVTTLIISLAAWWKTDPLRVLPQDQKPAADSAPAVTNITVSTPVASTPAISSGPGTVAQSEAATPAPAVPVEGTVTTDQPAAPAPAAPTV